MIIDRVFTPGLAQVAYLIADESTGEAAIIDPRRDVGEYVDWAKRHDFRFAAILESHVHADFVSGALELQAITGAPIYASRLGNQEFDHVPLDDRSRVAVGELVLEALWTPGHTPEHVAFLLIDSSRRPEPVAMFSGDLLFVGEVGRPDLLGTAQTRQLAEQLFETFSTRLERLRDDVIVYPGHTAGSSCGKKIGDAPHTTMGQERLFNYALQHHEQESFIAAVMAGMPKPPSYYPTMKVVNKVGPALLSTLPAGRALSADQMERAISSGAMLIDARSEGAFDEAHIPGGFYAGDTPDLVNWAGWLAPYDQATVLLLNDDADYERVRTELARIGIDRVEGYLKGGITTWIASGRRVKALAKISPLSLQASISRHDQITVVDVRTAEEWDNGHIAGAVNRFAGDITTGAGIPVEESHLVALTCATGYRSRVAASLLQSRGYRNLVQVEGGMDAWLDSGLPVVAA